MQNNAPWCLPHLAWGLYCAFLPGRDWLGAILLLIPGFNETSLIDISEHSGKVQTQLKALERIQGTGLGFFTALCWCWHSLSMCFHLAQAPAWPLWWLCMVSCVRGFWWSMNVIWVWQVTGHNQRCQSKPGSRWTVEEGMRRKRGQRRQGP